MKSPAPLILATVLMAGIASAQYAPIKQRARDASAATTERQNVTPEGNPGPNAYSSRYGLKPGQAPGALPPGAPPAAQPAVPVVPAAPVKPSAQQTAATKLKTDITEARAKGEATTDMKKQFVQDLAALAQGRIHPSPGTVSRFGESLLTTLAAKNASSADDTKLVKALMVCFNSAGLPPARLQELNAEVKAVLTKSGAPDAEVTLIGENLAAVVSDIQSGAPN